MSKPIELIVGLGNPGTRYQQTRHNAGEWFINALAKEYGETLRSEVKFHGNHAKITVAGKSIGLLVPTTYMNHSGQAVNAIAKFFKVPAESILVAHDELDLTCGTVKLKQQGGHAGHNGLRDIIAHLGTNHFPRLRIGIGHPGSKDLVLNYVLANPSKQQQQEMETAIGMATSVLPDLVTGNWEQAIQKLHS